MIQRVVIHRFRGIQRGTMKDWGKINLLIGPNNSGKSTLLELLYLSGLSGRLCSLIVENIEGGIWRATTLVRADFLGYEPLPRLRLRHRELSERHSAPATLTSEGGVRVELKNLPKEHPLRAFTLSVPLGIPGEEGEQFTSEEIGRIALFGLLPQEEPEPTRIGMKPPLFEEEQISAQKSFWYYLWDPAFVFRYEQQHPLDHLAIWAIEGRMPAADKVLFFDFHIISEPLEPGFVSRARENVPGWHNKIYDHLRRVFPALPEGHISIEDAPGRSGKKVGYLHSRDRPAMMIDHFGDGTRHAFKVLASLIALAESVDEEHPGLFLWEDPELFMHPASLGRLLQEVVGLIAPRPIQMLMTTQSLEVLAWLVETLESPPPGVSPSDVRTIHLNLQRGRLDPLVFQGREIVGWMEFVGDPRMIREDEMASPLIRLLRSRREAR